jgi:PAS domain S-box-containing protein
VPASRERETPTIRAVADRAARKLRPDPTKGLAGKVQIAGGLWLACHRCLGAFILDGHPMPVRSGHEQAKPDEAEGLRKRLQASESKLRESLLHEQQLADAEARSRSLLEHTPDPVLSVDRGGIVRFASRPPAGAPPGDLVGRSWLDLVEPRHHAIATSALETALRGDSAVTVDLMSTGDAKDVSWYSCRIGPLREAGRVKGAIVTVRDNTERRQTEAHLVATDRMASVGTLAAGVAHEINNPLAAVIANLELAINDVQDLNVPAATTDLLEELRDAREAAERVRLIVRDLKLFSRAEEDRRGPVDVREVLESTLRMAWNEIRHRARLIKTYDEVPTVEANEARLGQVFLNLVVNAAHAIPAGRAETNEIRLSTRWENDRVVVEIADSGAGMPAEVLKHIFTPFFSTKPAGVGTGLGLPICRRIVDDIGGEIRVTSREGVGSTFSVMLPASERTSHVAPSSRSSHAVPGRRGRVLVVDDEPMVAMAVRRTLSHHDVVTLNVTDEALSLVRSGERFDVILCDVMMPNMTGVDFYRELERVLPDEVCKIVFLTGGVFAPQTREFLDQIPNVRIEKPFSPDELRAIISERLEQAAEDAL